jgi:RNA polymerase sigma-70 factor (ECF subfamily)
VSSFPDDWRLPGGFERRLGAARLGSSEALGQLLEDCRNYLLLVANKELQTDTQAKVGPSDLVQETFLEAQRDFSRFDGGTETELLAWLRRILLNNVANVKRHYQGIEKRELAREIHFADAPLRELAGGCLAAEPSPSEHALSREQDALLDKALGELPELYRQVIVLRNRDNQSFEAIGQVLGRSPRAAGKLWARAVDQLRQIVESYESR